MSCYCYGEMYIKRLTCPNMNYTAQKQIMFGWHSSLSMLFVYGVHSNIVCLTAPWLVSLSIAWIKHDSSAFKYFVLYLVLVCLLFGLLPYSDVNLDNLLLADHWQGFGFLVRLEYSKYRNQNFYHLFLPAIYWARWWYQSGILCWSLGLGYLNQIAVLN